jgi:hypothetical protein
MHLALSYILFILLVVAAIYCFKVALTLTRVDKTESKKSAARVSSVINAILGRVRTHDDWMPDARVQGGLIFNQRKGRIEITGRLSDSTLERLFRRS